MKSFFIAAFAASTAFAEYYSAAGQPPICEVDTAGFTHVYYSSSVHPSFKCTHSGTTCACTLKHPTHHKGGCKQFESKTAGTTINGGGDCTDTGADPTTWSGSDLGADLNAADDGATFELAAGTIDASTWVNPDTDNWFGVTCTGKTLTVKGAGKGITILDAKQALRFFTLDSGCNLILKDLSLINGKIGGVHGRNDWGLYGGAIYVNSGASLDATNVEFKGNLANSGGAVFNKGTSCTFTSCAFTQNRAGQGNMGHGGCVITKMGITTFSTATPPNTFTDNVANPDPALAPGCWSYSGGTVVGTCNGVVGGRS